MHQALYRKWRPRTFHEVCGQEHITSVLRYQVAKGAVSHAYLFCGSRGTGKTTCAKILAKAVNCLSPVEGSPCGKCEACLAIDNGSATDVLEMDAASNNGVESIRDIRDEVVYTPSSLKYRVYIVDEVHMLSTSAFNALLKTLEEPPSHVIFILATTELHKLPATIISRCQRFDFRRIATPVLARRVSFIAGEEGLEIEPSAAERIARMAQGGMRDAISLLELCGSTRRAITVDVVNEMMGSGGRDKTIALLRAIGASDYDAIFGAVEEAVSSSRDILVFWQDLISLYRDLLVFKTAKNAAEYLDLTDAETAQLSELAATVTRATLLSHCKLLEEALFAMQRTNAVKRMVAELTLVRMCDMTLDTSPESMLARIARLEDAVAGIPMPISAPIGERPAATAAPSSSVPAAPAPTPTPVTPTPSSAAQSKTPTQAAPAASSGRTLQRMRGFMNCVERVKRENSMLAAFLGDVKAFLEGEERVVLQFPNAFSHKMASADSAKALIARAVSAELKRPLDVSALVLEVPEKGAVKDTVIDDLLDAVNGDA